MYLDTKPTAQTEVLNLEEELFFYNEASTTQRFFNFIIDAVIMQYTIAIATGFLLAIILYSTFPQLAASLFAPGDNLGNLVGIYLITIINYLVYYTFCEKVFQGKTLGKLITGTRAIRTDTHELTWRDAILRSLTRLVPFEPFSALGNNPWHDRWTNTMVIKKR